MTAAGAVHRLGFGSAATRGAQVGFWSAMVYGATVTFLIVLRSSLQIGRVLSLDEGLLGTLVANAFSVFWPCLITTLLLGAVAALLGMMAFGIIYALCQTGHRQRTPVQTVAIGFGVSALMVLLVNVSVIQVLGGFWDVFWPQGYLFWVGMPSLVFVAATTWVSRRNDV